MGRTGRSRIRKIKLQSNQTTELPSPVRLNNHPEIINISRYLQSSSSPSLRFTKAKVCPALFPFFTEVQRKDLDCESESTDDLVSNKNYGDKDEIQQKVNYYRGMCCNTKIIKPGTEILRISEELLITLNKLPTNITFFKELNGHSKLALYLLLESNLVSSVSTIKPYLDTLPKDFKNHPAYLSPSILSLLPEFCELPLRKQHENISSVLSKLRKYYEHDEKVLKLLTFDSFSYFWYCVYTRSVYYDYTNVEDKLSMSSQRECQLALAPYLDLFNHSPSPNTQVSFEASTSSKGNNHRFYVIRAIKPIKKLQEIFISYGNHANHTLWSDYGFVPRTRNPHNYIPLQFDSLIKSSSLFQSMLQDRRKVDVINKLTLTQELNLMETDVSYNLVQLITVCLWNLNLSTTVEYVNPTCPKYQQLLKAIIEHEIVNFKGSRDAVQKVIKEDDCNCVCALQETLMLLENSVDFLQNLLASYL